METNELRRLVALAASGHIGAEIWPNGIGYNAPGGWEYSIDERTDEWVATHHETGRIGRAKYHPLCAKFEATVKIVDEETGEMVEKGLVAMAEATN